MRRHKSLLERFMSHVSVKPTGCWLWTGGKHKKGYGQMKKLNYHERWHTVRATHVAWFFSRGFWPDTNRGQMVCHICDTPSCVRPSHLWCGTALENRQDAIEKGRQDGLTGEQLQEIWKEGQTQREIAKRLGVGQPTISKARKRNAKKAP